MPASWSAIAVMVTVLCSCPEPGLAQAGAASNRAAIERGRVLFEQHCAVCHAKDGRGDGPTAAMLASKPTNLTLMQHRHGDFFTAQVESAIRGTNPAVVHRAPGMIVWGAIFRADARGDGSAADARMRDLLAFIESIQQK